MKRPSRWLVLLTLLASVAVASAGVVPHGDDDQSCLVCKVRTQPLQAQTGAPSLQEPPSATLGTIPLQFFALPSVSVGSTSPRAPPA